MQGAASAWRWTVQDALGSVRGDFDAALDMQASRGYAPYGEALGEQGDFASPFGFTGGPVDVNGLLHLRARYYEPGMGRFLNQDPSWSEQNLYEYGTSNPVNSRDPLGLCAAQPGIVAQDICELLASIGGFLFDILCPDFLSSDQDPSSILRELGPEETTIPYLPNVATNIPETDAQRKLQALCQSGDADACRQLQLSYECRAGDNNSCEQLRRECNQLKNIDDFRAALVCKARSTCSDIQEKELQDNKDNHCNKPRLCNTQTSCQEIRERILQGWLCEIHREIVLNTCYQGRGDWGHEDALGRTMRTTNKCISQYFTFSPARGRHCDPDQFPRLP